MSQLHRAPALLALLLIIASCGGEDTSTVTSLAESSLLGADPVRAEQHEPEGQQPAPASGTPIDAATALAKQSTQDEAARRAEAAPALTSTFKHDVGFYFKYPEGWSLQPEGENFLIVTPSDPYEIDGQPGEVFIVMGDSADSMTDINDRKASRTAQDMIEELLPFLRRKGPIERRSFARHDGIVLTWEGKSPAGVECRAKLWAAILNGYAIGILALTPKERFGLHEQIIEDMFSTFGFTKPKLDTRLLGQWRHEKVYMSGSFSTITTEYMTLNADGSCAWSSRLMAGGSSSSADSGESGGGGRWRVSGKTLQLSWNESTKEEWTYYIEGSSLLFKTDRSKKLWERVR